MKIIMNTAELTALIKEKYPNVDQVTIYYVEPSKVLEERLGKREIERMQTPPVPISHIINL